MKPDKPYRQYIRVKEKGKAIKIIKRFRFKKPKAKIVNRYEKYSQEFKSSLARDLQVQGDKLEKKDAIKNIDINEIAKKIVANRQRYFKVRGNRIMAIKQKIEIDFGVGSMMAKRIKALAEELDNEQRKEKQ
jgi:hypothetical protein